MSLPKLRSNAPQGRSPTTSLFTLLVIAGAITMTWSHGGATSREEDVKRNSHSLSSTVEGDNPRPMLTLWPPDELPRPQECSDLLSMMSSPTCAAFTEACHKQTQAYAVRIAVCGTMGMFTCTGYASFSQSMTLRMCLSGNEVASKTELCCAFYESVILGAGGGVSGSPPPGSAPTPSLSPSPSGSVSPSLPTAVAGSPSAVGDESSAGAGTSPRTGGGILPTTTLSFPSSS